MKLVNQIDEKIANAFGQAEHHKKTLQKLLIGGNPHPLFASEAAFLQFE